VILAHTTPVVAVLQQESPAIPIVFVNVSDPIGSRFIASLSRPGGNLTGVLHYEAAYVDRILRGDKPADLPVQAPNQV
jgi:putative tryptophan/tyrosine transport system substrate-binding protein